MYDAVKQRVDYLLLTTPPPVAGPNASSMEEVLEALRGVQLKMVDYAWCFDPKYFVRKVSSNPLEDPVDVSAQAKIAEAYQEALQRCFEYPQGQGQGQHSDVVHELQNLLFDINMRSREKGGWRALLYRTDGSVDLDMDLQPWNPEEQVDIMREKLKYVQLKGVERDREHTRTIQRLQDSLLRQHSAQPTTGEHTASGGNDGGNNGNCGRLPGSGAQRAAAAAGEGTAATRAGSSAQLAVPDLQCAHSGDPRLGEGEGFADEHSANLAQERARYDKALQLMEHAAKHALHAMTQLVQSTGPSRGVAGAGHGTAEETPPQYSNFPSSSSSNRAQSGVLPGPFTVNPPSAFTDVFPHRTNEPRRDAFVDGLEKRPQLPGSPPASQQQRRPSTATGAATGPGASTSALSKPATTARSETVEFVSIAQSLVLPLPSGSGGGVATGCGPRRLSEESRAAGSRDHKHLLLQRPRSGLPLGGSSSTIITKRDLLASTNASAVVACANSSIYHAPANLGRGSLLQQQEAWDQAAAAKRRDQNREAMKIARPFTATAGGLRPSKNDVPLWGAHATAQPVQQTQLPAPLRGHPPPAMEGPAAAVLPGYRPLSPSENVPHVESAKVTTGADGTVFDDENSFDTNPTVTSQSQSLTQPHLPLVSEAGVSNHAVEWLAHSLNSAVESLAKKFNLAPLAHNFRAARGYQSEAAVRDANHNQGAKLTLTETSVEYEQVHVGEAGIENSLSEDDRPELAVRPSSPQLQPPPHPVDQSASYENVLSCLLPADHSSVAHTHGDSASYALIVRSRYLEHVREAQQLQAVLVSLLGPEDLSARLSIEDDPQEQQRRALAQEQALAHYRKSIPAPIGGPSKASRLISADLSAFLETATQLHQHTSDRSARVRRVDTNGESKGKSNSQSSLRNKRFKQRASNALPCSNADDNQTPLNMHKR